MFKVAAEGPNQAHESYCPPEVAAAMHPHAADCMHGTNNMTDRESAPDIATTITDEMVLFAKRGEAYRTSKGKGLLVLYK